MKKFLVLILALALSFTLVGCDDEEELANIPDEVAMEDLDDFMERNDVQYVDLRNFDDKMAAGYIAGFEFIPFLDYLEKMDILVRTDGDYTFAAEDILGQGTLRELFDEDKTIFLMCAGGTRAGYVKAALESLGYENVVNIGGFSDYAGEFKVLGDGVFVLEHPASGPYTPGTYFGYEGAYTVVISINATGAIVDVFFDAVTCEEDEFDVIISCTTKQVLGDDYGMMNNPAATAEWWVQANTMADAIVEAQGWDVAWTMTDGKFDDFAGVTITASYFQVAVEMALGLATP